MQLSRTGVLAKFYRWNYYHEPPKNLCPFFWLELWAMLWLPCSIFSVWMGEVREGLAMRVVMGLLTLILLFFVSGILFFGVYMHPWGFMEVVASIVAGISVLVGLFLLGCVISGYFTETESGIEIVAVMREKKASVKDKYCPRIDWK